MSSTVFCAIISGRNNPKPLIDRFSSSGISLIDEQMSNPHVHFLIDDSVLGVMIMRFFKQHFFRNAVIYHTGEKPRYNMRPVELAFKTRGSFISEAEVKAAMIADSTMTIVI